MLCSRISISGALPAGGTDSADLYLGSPPGATTFLGRSTRLTPTLETHRTADREPRLSPSSARLSGLGQAIFRYTGCVLHSIIQCSPAQCSHKGRLPRLAGPVSGASIPLPTSCCRCSRSKLPLSGGAPRMEGAHRRQPALVRPARLASLAFFPLCPTARTFSLLSLLSSGASLWMILQHNLAH